MSETPPFTNAPGVAHHQPFPPRTHFRSFRNHPPFMTSRTPEDAQRILQQLQNETGFSFVGEAGIRRFQCPQNLWPEGQMVQMQGCEIFLGRLPKDLLEDEIYALCKQFGDILEIRMMLEPEQNQQPNRMQLNRGYAFVLFRNRESAKSAIENLDRWEIRPGYKIGVKKSVDNCRLFVGGLPRDKTKEEFETEIRKHPCCASTMRKVIMYPAIADKSKNRGFAFVEFASHRDAAVARRQLMRERATLWGKDLCVDWAQPEPEVDQSIMDQVRVVYVRNLSTSTTEDTLHRIFGDAAETGPIEKIKKLRDFAFVHFADRADAQRAIEQLNGIEIDGCQIEVMWAKPPSSVRLRQQAFENQQNVAFGPSTWINNPMYQNPVHFYGRPNFHQHQMPFLPFQPSYPTVTGFARHLSSPQRHYRNAAGTRRTYGRQSGQQTPNTLDPMELIPMHTQIPHGFVDTHGYYFQEPLNGYSSFYNPAQFYGHPGPFASSGIQTPQHFPHMQQQQMPVHEVLAQVYTQLPNLSINNGNDFPPLNASQNHFHSQQGPENQQLFMQNVVAN